MTEQLLKDYLLHYNLNIYPEFIITDINSHLGGVIFCESEDVLFGEFKQHHIDMLDLLVFVYETKGGDK